MSLEATSQLETVTPFTVGSEVTYNLLPNAIKKELDCMEKLKNLFSNIPEEMCYRSKQSDAIAHTTNDMCWTGSTLGRLDTHTHTYMCTHTQPFSLMGVCDT